jgi:ankyrin repeat protein
MGLTSQKFAIDAGNIEVVNLLLDSGADANQTYGTRDVSPLNTAFHVGRPDIIRALLKAKRGAGDLNYVNSRTWTCLSYAWDPNFCHSDNVISLILDICAGEAFDGWELGDMTGWTPYHRGTAFGKAEHIKKLQNLNVVSKYDYPVTIVNWSPIQSAVRHGNNSTFKFLTQDKHTLELLHLVDTRGWNLLHLATASGSEELVSYLLSLGFDPNSLTDRSSLGAYDLQNRNLTPRMIADHYGHSTAYDHALRSAGLSDSQESAVTNDNNHEMETQQ